MNPSYVLPQFVYLGKSIKAGATTESEILCLANLLDYLCILRSEMEKARAAGIAPELVAAAEKLFKDEFFRSNDLTGSMLLKRRNDAGVLIEKFRNISR